MKINTTRHIAFQILLWCTSWLFVMIILTKEGEFDAHFWYRAFLVGLGIAVVVFINLKWLLPKFYFQKKRLLYVLFSAVILSLVVWGVHSDFLPWNHKETSKVVNLRKRSNSDRRKDVYDQENDSRFRWLLRNLPPLFIGLLGSSLISVSRFVREKEKETVQLEKAKLETELKFLKSQINPHFLFNSLHNIYGSTIIQSEKAPEQLLKLSDILRYMLYDSNEESVSLEREITYLKNYLELAQLKDSRGLDVKFNVIEQHKGITVAPLLFIPFVENAFKHSQIEDLNNGYIHINLETVKNRLIFNVVNSKPKMKYSKDKVGGIGLKNIRQRLELLYPNRHHLRIEETETIFSVHLELNCS